MICVTGGAGFVGSHLCAALIKEGSTVFALDNFHTGKKANLSGIPDMGRLTVVEHDVTEPLPDHLPRFAEIYNLACPASPVHYQADPVKTLQICSTGTMNVLQRAKQDRSRLFHASTSEIYGDPLVHPQSESYWGNVNPVGPRSCYDEGKRFAEALVTDFARQNGLTARMARIFNTYGPQMQPDDGRVVSNFIIQALKGEEITLYGDGSQTRSFCYVSDLVRGIIGLTRFHGKTPPAVNLGSTDEMTVKVLAETILRLTGSPSRLVYRPLPTDDPTRRRPSVCQIEAICGWRPTVPLEEGVALTITYFAERLALGKTTHELPARLKEVA
jgi:UDP-glucuronate decarboxylase